MTTQPPASRPPKLDLPFTSGSGDPGAWAYDHRVGLCVTVIAYLLAGIVFVSARIALGGTTPLAGMYIEFTDDPSAREPLPERAAQLAMGEELTGVQNRISNQNADAGGGRSEVGGQSLSSTLRDDRGTNAADVYAEAAAAQAASAANRRAYEAGLEEVRRISENGRAAGSTQGTGDRKVQGRVTVSFSLINPLRRSAYLFVPAYQCEGGGELIVAITVNRNGNVTAAAVSEASASVDECMRRTAVGAALASRFNVDGAAPEKQQGTITYIFIPQ